MGNVTEPMHAQEYRRLSQSGGVLLYTTNTRDEGFFSLCLRWFVSSSSSSSSSSSVKQREGYAKTGISSKSSSSLVNCEKRRRGESSASSSYSYSTETTPTSKISSTKIVNNMTEQPKKNHVVFVLGGPG